MIILKSEGKSSDKQFKYFKYKYKNVSDLAKHYLLSKIHEIHTILLEDLRF